jgi:hypothetical protein
MDPGARIIATFFLVSRNPVGSGACVPGIVCTLRTRRPADRNGTAPGQSLVEVVSKFAPPLMTQRRDSASQLRRWSPDPSTTPHAAEESALPHAFEHRYAW